MDCPQCGAEVPSDDLFCGKCGYAMRDGGPERVDQSRIRVHEEREDDPSQEPPGRGASQQRIRKHTMMGMPAATPPRGTPSPASATPPSPPTEISTARSRAQKRTPQKTMLGIPRPELAELPSSSGSAPSDALPGETLPGSSDDAESAASGASSRARARVRYDSANEPFPVVQRRQKALRGLALLVLLAGAWLAYRYLSLNG